MTLARFAKLAPLAATAVVVALLFTFGGIRYPGFASFNNVIALLDGNSFLGIAAVGSTFVVLSGGIDLSVGAMIAFTSTLTAALLERGGLPLPVAIAVALLVGTFAGFCMGGLIHFFELPPFMVTLAAMFFLRAMGFVIEAQAKTISNPSVLKISLGGVGGVPNLTLAMGAIFVVAMVVAHLTPFGRNVYAIGGSEPSAKLMGLPVGKTKILIYTLAGLCSALAGVAAAIYKSSGDPAGYVGNELDVIAAVVIGGTLLTGGVGYLLGTFLGITILGLIQSIIYFEGTLSAAWARIAVGSLLLGFILLQKGLTRLAR